METNYTTEQMTLKDLERFIKLPAFQRSVVWTDDKKKSFIDTVTNGLPFGSLLLYKENPNEYLLIDGLQRYSTLRDYVNNFSKYISIEEKCKEQLNDLINRLKENKVPVYNELKKNIVSAIEKYFSFGDISDIVGDIIEEIPLLNDNYKLASRCISQIVDFLRRQYDIRDLKIPLIVFNGNFNILPDIFERMNTNGTQLSKFDIFSAKWGSIQFPCHDVNILSLVDQKYKTMMEETDVEIRNYEDGQFVREQYLNLYEFCFAFGRQIKDDVSGLFKKKSKSTAESIGFTLLAMILMSNTKNINGISDCFKDMTDEKCINLIKFKDKIIECAKSVYQYLEPCVTTLSGENIAEDSETQTLCIITTLFNIRYVVDKNTFCTYDNIEGRKFKKVFETNICKRYLNDLIIGFWSGSGDTKATDIIKRDLSDNPYLIVISESKWRSDLFDWFTNQTQKKMGIIPNKNRIFLNYITKKTANPQKYSNKKYEVNYIISKNRFKKFFKDKNGLSAIGNLCILPFNESHGKNDLTIYEYSDNKTLFYLENDILSDFLYPQKSEVSFIFSPESSTYENYARFIKDRHNFLINKFIELVI